MIESRTVVIVDDEPITRMDISSMLEEYGYEVVGRATDGFDAVELCRLHIPEIVIMDIKMPTFDGLTAADTIVREGIGRCVIILSAYSSPDLVERAGRIGVCGYLVKPVSQQALLTSLEIAVAQGARMESYRQEIGKLRQDMRDTKIINHAKAILAEQGGITETEAFKNMHKMSMDKRCSLVSLSQAIIATHSSREMINKAKELIMHSKGISEAAAYKYLQEEAKKQGHQVGEFARMLMEGQI